MSVVAQINLELADVQALRRNEPVIVDVPFLRDQDRLPALTVRIEQISTSDEVELEHNGMIQRKVEFVPDASGGPMETQRETADRTVGRRDTRTIAIESHTSRALGIDLRGAHRDRALPGVCVPVGTGGTMSTLPAVRVV